MHGAAFATFAGGSAAGFEWLCDEGEEAVSEYVSAGSWVRRFCGRCGSVAPTVIGDNAFVAAGCFDDDPGSPATPPFHMFVGSKAGWARVPADGAQRYEGAPPDYEPPPELPPAPELPPLSGPGRIRGGCLCGGVAWEVGPAAGLVHCHCSRCRKSHSAAHASNFMAAGEGFGYTRGAELVRTYKVPEAERFTTAFCTTCGSNVPRRPGAGADFVVVPAGGVETEVGPLPEVHIFVGSKAPWFEIGDDIPRYDTYVPGFASSGEWAKAQS